MGGRSIVLVGVARRLLRPGSMERIEMCVWAGVYSVLWDHGMSCPAHVFWYVLGREQIVDGCGWQRF